MTGTKGVLVFKVLGAPFLGTKTSNRFLILSGYGSGIENPVK